jgi:hypothetical protein
MPLKPDHGLVFSLPSQVQSKTGRRRPGQWLSSGAKKSVIFAGDGRVKSWMFIETGHTPKYVRFFILIVDQERVCPWNPIV